jgi:hypothetical protein
VFSVFGLFSCEVVGAPWIQLFRVDPQPGCDPFDNSRAMIAQKGRWGDECGNYAANAEFS